MPPRLVRRDEVGVHSLGNQKLHHSVGALLRQLLVGVLCWWQAFRDALLPAAYGYLVKLRVPTKLGFKNPNHIVAIEVTNVYPDGFWENYGCNWFSGS